MSATVWESGKENIVLVKAERFLPPGANPLKDAHAALDAAVLAAYGFSAKKDLLAQLLKLNLDVAARIASTQPVTAPGIPPAERLITDDCIRPA